MKVLLVAEQVLFREGLQSLLQSNGVEVVGTARNGAEALEEARVFGPDVVLMDVTGCARDGLATIRRLKGEMPLVKTVVLAASGEHLLAAVRSGACGYLLTNTAGDELLQRLRDLERGEVPFSAGLTARLLEGFASLGREEADPAVRPGRRLDLTSRQKEVLALVVRGLTYREVATVLGLRERTVKYHMGRIRKLLHIKKRNQVIAYALAGDDGPEP